MLPKRVNINKNILDADRKRIIDAYNDGKTPKKISNFLGIKLPTVYSILRIYQKERRIEKKTEAEFISKN